MKVSGKTAEKAKSGFSWKHLLALLLLWRAYIFLIQLIAFRLLGDNSSISYIAFETMGLWDGYWHSQIAKFGYYAEGLTLRFPLYPMLMRLLAPVTMGNELSAGLVISFGSLFLALLFMYRLAVREFGDERLAIRGIVLFLLFPTSFFLAAAYGESLFLLLTVASFFFFREKKMLLASVLGGLAVLVRLQGLLLFPAFILERILKTRKWERSNFYFFIIPLALLPWCWFLWEKFGDPFLFLHDLSRWDEGPLQRARILTFPSSVFFSYVSEMVVVLSSIGGGVIDVVLVQLKEISDFIFFLFSFFLGLFVFRYLSASYSIYHFSSLLLMLSIGTLKGAPRFVLVLFPGFFVLAKLLKKPRLLFISLVISLVGLIGFLLLFSFRYWVA